MQTNNHIHHLLLKKTRVYAPILIGVSIIVIVFLLYPLYVSHVDNQMMIQSLEKTKAEKQSQIDKITQMQALFAGTGSSDLKEKVRKYNRPFNTSNIMEMVMLNRFTKSSQFVPASVTIGWITVNPGKKLPSGLSLSTVSFGLSANTPDQIIDYITYLTTEAPMAFTIDSISLPLDTAWLSPNTGVSLSISLGVYYYE